MLRKEKTVLSDNEENYRSLINYCYKWSKQNIRCIAVTSYIENQGRTMLVETLGSKLAAAGYKTLIIDCDVIKPTLSKRFCCRRSEGILEIEEKINKSKGKIVTANILEYAQETEVENLYFYSRGGYLEKTQEKYINERTIKYLLEILKQQFMFILLDIPSFKYLSYAQVFLSGADGYLLMIKSDTILLREVKAIKKKIKKIDCQLLGAILNDKYFNRD